MYSHTNLAPTGDSELDALAQQKIREELARLERNQERRLHREKLKAKNIANASAAGSPAAAASPGPGPSSPAMSELAGSAPAPAPNASKPGKGRSKDGTARKCANCGQVGHIKTNRKSVQPPPKFVCTCENPDFGPEEEKKKKPRASRKRKAGGPDAPDSSGVVGPASKKTVPAGGAFTMGNLDL